MDISYFNNIGNIMGTEQTIIARSGGVFNSFPRLLKTTDEYIHPVAKVGRVSRYAVKLTDRFTNVPGFVKMPLKACKLCKTIRGPGFIKKLNKHTQRAVGHVVTEPKKATKDLIRVGRDVKKVAASLAFPCKMLNSCGVLPDAAVAWIPVFSVVHPFMSLTSLSMAVSKYKKTHDQVHSDEQRVSLLSRTNGHVRKVQVLTQILKDLREQDLESLQKKLCFSKDVDLAGRIDRISSQLRDRRTQALALAEGEDFLNKIAGRSAHLANLSTLRVGLKVARVSGWAMSSLLGFPTVGLGLLTVASTVMAGSWFWQKFGLSANPFS
jgi:hypothetical protein